MGQASIRRFDSAYTRLPPPLKPNGVITNAVAKA